MGEVVHRLLQAIRLQRDAFVWMDFNDRATGDALILVALTEVVLLLGLGASVLGLVFGLPSVVGAILQALIQWLVVAAVSFAAVRYLFNGEGGYATYLRIVGFAFPTLILWLFTVKIIDNGELALFVGAVWFLAVVAYGVHYIADLDLAKSATAAVLGYVGWRILSAIFSGGFLF
jgi:hypothetical protein